MSRCRDESGLSALEEFVNEKNRLTSDSNYLLAKTIRDHSTNHYLVSPAAANLQYVSKNAKVAAYLHETQGNSYYPIGEEVVFSGRLSRHFNEQYSRDVTPSYSRNVCVDSYVRLKVL
jgi:hypothetical protein